jgi:hypothetical protein
MKAKIISLLSVAAVCLFAASCRRGEGGDRGASPATTPATITASSGDGTAVSYQVSESNGVLTVTPGVAKPGQSVKLEWNVPDAEDNTVKIEGVGKTFSHAGSLTVSAPEADKAWGATTGLHIYRLEARRKGGGETIKLEAQLKVSE